MNKYIYRRRLASARSGCDGACTYLNPYYHMYASGAPRETGGRRHGQRERVAVGIGASALVREQMILSPVVWRGVHYL